MQLNFVSFKFIIQISYLLKNKEINYHNNQNSLQNYNVILAKIKMKLKE